MIGSTPLWVRKFIVDFIETGIAAVLGLSLVFPQSVGDLKALLLAVGIAILGALASAVRRELPDFLVWLKTQLGTITA